MASQFITQVSLRSVPSPLLLSALIGLVTLPVAQHQHLNLDLSQFPHQVIDTIPVLVEVAIPVCPEFEQLVKYREP